MEIFILIKISFVSLEVSLPQFFATQKSGSLIRGSLKKFLILQIHIVV